MHTRDDLNCTRGYEVSGATPTDFLWATLTQSFLSVGMRAPLHRTAPHFAVLANEGSQEKKP